MEWVYQKREDDCWLCALKNLFLYLGKPVEYEDMLSLLEKRGLYTHGLAGFFTYIPLILADLGYKSDFYVPQNSCFYGEYLKDLETDSLEFLFQKYAEENDGLCFLYKSVIQILDTKKITLHRQPVDFGASENKILLTHVSSNEYYGLSGDDDNHVLLIIPPNMVIDPYKKMGEKNIEAWQQCKEVAKKYDWTDFHNCAVSLDCPRRNSME